MRTACVAGFSSVLLGLMVVYVYKFTYSETVRLYGLVNVPTPAAPWIVFVVFMFVPGTSTLVSFACHFLQIVEQLAQQQKGNLS
jgi:hypothetical protein